MWPLGVVVNAPAFCQHARLLQGIEDFTVQKLVAHLGVEVFTIAVLPGRAGFYREKVISLVSSAFSGRVVEMSIRQRFSAGGRVCEKGFLEIPGTL
jgi:hypothetical protein